MKDEWRVESDLIEHLATELLANRLGLFLGAGQSGFYGLPGWKDLVNRLSQMHSFEPLGDGDDSMLRMARIKSVHYSNQNEEFLADVKKELYKDVSIDFDKIRSSQLLSAIGALLMVSSRGSASTVFTLNYDDLLEIYLEYHGVVTRSICEEVHWANNADVTIYHPHGLLPLSEHRSSSKDIVISAHDYDLIMKEGSVWRNLLVTSLRTHTFLYIGLSGDDPNLKGMIAQVKESHAINDDRIAYHGVRFSKNVDDDLTSYLDDNGLYTHKITHYDEIHTILFQVCQRARELREEQLYN